jgi:hypothetical protein
MEKEEHLIENHTPFPIVRYEIHTEASSLRTPKIMPRNLNEIVYVHEFAYNTISKSAKLSRLAPVFLAD